MVSTVRIKRMKSEMDSFGGYVAPLSMLDAEKDIAVIFFTIRTRRKNEGEGREGGNIPFSRTNFLTTFDIYFSFGTFTSDDSNIRNSNLDVMGKRNRKGERSPTQRS